MSKLGFVVRMVADSILPNAECGPNDYRKVAPPFRTKDTRSLSEIRSLTYLPVTKDELARVTKNLFLLEHFKDNDSFRCFDFIGDEFCGKVDVYYHKRYTKQIFDFFDRNFPGVNISEGMRSKHLSYFVLIEINVTFSTMAFC